MPTDVYSKTFFLCKVMYWVLGLKHIFVDRLLTALDGSIIILHNVEAPGIKPRNSKFMGQHVTKAVTIKSDGKFHKAK